VRSFTSTDGKRFSYKNIKTFGFAINCATTECLSWSVSSVAASKWSTEVDVGFMDLTQSRKIFAREVWFAEFWC